MRILAVSHSCVADVNQQLYIALDSLPDTHVELVVPANWKSEYTGKALTPEKLAGADFPIHALPVLIPGNNSLHFYRDGLTRIIRQARPDVIFLDEEPWSFAAWQTLQASRRLGVPFVCYTKQNIRKQYPFPFSRIERGVYSSASALIALSEEVRAVLQQKGFRGPCPLLAHACDLSLFSANRPPGLRRDLGLPHDSLVVGFMGRFVPEKGLDTLVDAVALLCRDAPGLDVRALLIGSGPEEQALKRRAEQAGLAARFVFPGPVPHRQAGEYMNCFDIFVLPSLTMPRWKEQFGRVIIEAMACEVPVVGSDSGEIPHLIASTGGGLVFREGDAGDLAERMARLVDDPGLRRDLGRAGAAAVKRDYTFEAVAARLYDVLASARRGEAAPPADPVAP